MTLFSWPRVRLGISAFLVIAVLGMLTGCDDKEPNGGDSRVRVVATLEIFADMARNVGGDEVDVDALLPAGADPHTFEVAPTRVVDIVEADIVIMNGLGLEESIHDVIETNAEGEVIELAAGLPILDGEDAQGGAREHSANPHLWLDARLAARYVESIRDAMIAVDPSRRATYESNATAYLEEIGQLDREIEDAVSSIPAERRKLVTLHDAFPYFASRYGLEIVAVAVPSPGQEPSAKDIADLAAVLRSEDVPAVFAEPQFSSSVLDAAAGDAGVRVLDLLSDAYASDVDSYLELMRFNAGQLIEGLGE
jgi:zinc/manganese transport system substrate-binding protein/manganese/iron transport system substrate-binding protein